MRTLKAYNRGIPMIVSHTDVPFIKQTKMIIMFTKGTMKRTVISSFISDNNIAKL